MVTTTESNPLKELFTSIYNEFSWLKYNRNNLIGKSVNEHESLLKLILENNGCAFSNDPIIHFCTLDKLNTPNYIIGYLYGAKANEVNNYYDYIEFYGTKYLILFMDYFKNIFDEPTPVIGRSNYFDAIKGFVDVFISTTTNAAELMGSLSTTAASNMYRFAGIFIAAEIIDSLFGLEEDDVSMIKYSDLKEMLDLGLDFLLLGIKYKE